MEWKPGSKRSGFFPIQGGGAELPVTMICGDRPGCTVLISGGVHSSEYVGIQAAIELAAELMPERIACTVTENFFVKADAYINAGDCVRKGEVIGEVRDFFGNGIWRRVHAASD